MFVIASSGRAGTMALCHGLDRYSDHRVEHEPDQPLAEGWRLHRGDHLPPHALAEWRQRLAREDGAAYGLSWRVPNLLGEVRRAAPRARVLVIVRNPREYVRSAHSKRVLSKATAWDRFRLMPRSGVADGLPLAERIAWHWRTVNDYLLDFATADEGSRVVLLDRPLEDVADAWACSLGVAITNADGFHSFLRGRPNAGSRAAPPPGFSLEAVDRIGAPTWARAVTLAKACRVPGSVAQQRGRASPTT